MAKYKQATNTDLEAKGVWSEYGNFRVRIGRAGGGNKQFMQCMERLAKPIRRALQADMISDERSRQLLRDAYAESVILDWQIRDDETKDEWKPGMWSLEDDTVIPFTVDNVKAFIDDDRMHDYWADFRNLANSNALFRKVLAENDTKN